MNLNEPYEKNNDSRVGITEAEYEAERAKILNGK